MKWCQNAKKGTWEADFGAFNLRIIDRPGMIEQVAWFIYVHDTILIDNGYSSCMEYAADECLKRFREYMEGAMYDLWEQLK